tara:strand:- start:1794 stop:2078 length:285 start_codon:yes stop_codon:yes gene_type:complete
MEMHNPDYANLAGLGDIIKAYHFDVLPENKDKKESYLIGRVIDKDDHWYTVEVMVDVIHGKDSNRSTSKGYGHSRVPFHTPHNPWFYTERVSLL